jgi:TPR repeat protein
MLENGHGIKQNHIKAKEFYRKACKGGIKNGCKKM